MKAKKDRLGLFVLGITLALLGQFILSYRRVFWRDGLFLWSLAILAFALLLYRASAGWGRWRDRRWIVWARESPRNKRMRLIASVGGIAFVLIAAWTARGRDPKADFGGLLWMWLFGVCWLLLTFVPSSLFASGIRKRWTRWFHVHRRECIGLAALWLMALAVRTVGLERIPVNLGGDEGTWGMEALAMLGGRMANPFATRWFAFPSLSFLAWGVGMRLFGDTVAGLRALSALLGATAVLTTFVLARDLWGARVAWFSSIALALGHYHIHFSRLAVNNIADSLLVTLALWLFIKGIRMRGHAAFYFALAGVVTGLGWYGYFGARLIGVISAGYVAWRSVLDFRFLARYKRLLLIWAGVALVVAAPLLFYYVDYPSTFSEGFNRVSIFASGWLEREMEITGHSALRLLLQQFWKSISAFNYTLDPTFWYRARIPLLDFVSGVFFIFGLVWAVWRHDWPSNGLLLLWFGSALIFGWVTTENPPSSQRMVIAAPAAALFVGLGMNCLMELGRRLFGGRVIMWQRITMGALLLIAGLNLGYYFFVYTPTRVYGNPTAELATELARDLTNWNDEGSYPGVVYFHGAPFINWDFGTLRFMARDVAGVNVPPFHEGASDEDEPPAPNLERGALFVFHPERLNELAYIQTQYPDGVVKHIHSTADQRLLYVTYAIDADNVHPADNVYPSAE